ncbi:MAG: ferredoxin reductase, partial [Pseudoxanthomonas sp.]
MNALVRPSHPRPRNRLKRLIQPLVVPQVFDFWASKVNPTWSWDRPMARITGRRAESADSVTLWLQPNRHWAGFQPGQHLNVTAQLDGVRVTRSYSLTNASAADGRLAITVKRVDGGSLSRHLCTSARIGEVLEIGQAFGDMTLPASPQGNWLFLAAGSGITPLMSMTRALAAQGMPVPLTLMYWARTRQELCFVDELKKCAAEHSNFSVHFVLTREPIAGDEATGRLSATMIRALVDDPSTRQVFACGPGGFVDTARIALASSVQSFHTEAFSPPPRLVEDGGNVQVTLAASGRTL